jgi:hypothetical protein
MAKKTVTIKVNIVCHNEDVADIVRQSLKNTEVDRAIEYAVEIGLLERTELLFGDIDVQLDLKGANVT